MTNDSASGGYLAPSTTIIDDDALDDIFQAMVVGITGLSGDLVRPRFQAEPGNLPDFTATWCAIGVMEFEPDTYATLIHNPAGVGTSIQQSHEGISVMATFYGPAAQATARILARGLLLPQNQEVIAAAGILFTKAERPIKAPQLLKNRWVNRIDVTLQFRRQDDLIYPIRNLVSASGQIDAENVQEQFEVSP